MLFLRLLLALQCCISDAVKISEFLKGLRNHILYQTVSPGRCHSESSQVGVPSVRILRPPDADRAVYVCMPTSHAGRS